MMPEVESPEPFKENPWMKKLLEIGLPPKDYAIVGSAPMALHGLKTLTNDIDVIARGAAWEKAKQYCFPEESPMKFGNFLKMFDGKVEVYHCWFPKDAWNVDELIDTAEIVDGVRYVKLEYVLKYKKSRNFPKDTTDIKLIEDYLSIKKTCPSSET
jgi:hypothetical protein